MAKDPADRYQTPADLVAALAPFCREGFPVAIAVEPRREAGPAEGNEWASLTDNGDREQGGAVLAKSGGRTVALPRRGAKKAGGAADPEAAEKKRELLLAGAGGGVGLLLVIGLLGVVLWSRSGSEPDPRMTQAPPATQTARKGPDTPAEGARGSPSRASP
jgi:hypothetical protein